ncbi:MAG: prepilin-type N-terminal cleavage/methylation domain-containing protein [Oligosphaeraceae bacterium]|nr:prepilin-type N-terminal cleavage/methylation domain-containing protein [Oligosphaeraceae bacterium]
MRYTNKDKRARHYTLIELMIAMAILVIMMGFLFQFVNSAQRLWSASSGTEDSFDRAHLCFDYLERDFIGAIMQDEESNPGKGIGFIMDTNEYEATAASPNFIFLLGLVSQVDSNNATDTTGGSAAFPIIYFLKKITNPVNSSVSFSLYRLIIDSTMAGLAPFGFYGDSTAFYSQVNSSMASLPADNSRLLCENIASIKLGVHPSSMSSGSKLPELVKINLNLFDTGVKDSSQPNTRTFSKVIMLQ